MAQQYHASHGSPYAGAVNIFNNPASSVNSVYKWDLNILSSQTTISTNHLNLENFSYKNPGNTVLNVDDGTNSYFGHQSTDLNLFSFQFQPNNKQAFSIAFRGRMYDHIKINPVAFSDTITTFYSFLKMNRSNPPLGGYMTHAGFLEVNLNYSQELIATSNSRLTGGINLNISRAISGMYAKSNRVATSEIRNGLDTNYYFVDGRLEYGYSENYDANASSTNAATAKAFLKNSKTNFGLSLGLEFTTYKDAVEEGGIYHPLAYDWKIGLSIMDIGNNSFKPSTTSASYSEPSIITDYATLENKFNNIGSLIDLKDTLKTIFNSYDSLSNTIVISKPTRVILNVDKNLGNHFAINAALNMNLFSTANYKHLRTRETNLLTITPRWENILWGFYLPMQYNSQGQVWIGAAIKMGPLTIGLHDISGGKRIKSVNGGGYLLLSIHPFNKKKVLTRLDCPI